MDQIEPTEALLDANDVAEWLGVAPATVYEHVARGNLPAIRLWKGRRRTLLRFRRADIAEFIRQRTITATSLGSR
jgi:excisionase family DNA binding protein